MSITIRSGSVRVRVFYSRSGKYLRHEIRWTDHHGRRRRLKRSNRSEALREARRIADDLARGHHQAELSLADLASFRAGVINLLGLGKTLELGTAEYAEALRKIRKHHPAASLAEAVEFYLSHRGQALAELTVEQAVREFLAEKAGQGLSRRWLDTLTGQLNRFAAENPGPSKLLTAQRVQVWFHGLDGMGARSKNNHLAAVQGLFSSAAFAFHPARKAVAELQPLKTAPVDPKTWKPEEFRRLLHAAGPDLVPVLALGGFAAVRNSEIRRLRWDQIQLEDGHLRIFRGQGKDRNKRRLVKLPGACVAWLRTVAKSDGPLWPWGVSRFSKRVRALAAACGYTWRENALRKSAITYRELLDCDVRNTAREAGNSAAMIEEYYLAFDGVRRSDATAWFEIYPPEGAVIVPLSAAK